MNMGGIVDFVIMVDDVEFIPTFKQVEDVIRLLDMHGLTANNYPSTMENKIFIRDMERKKVIRSESDLRADLKDPERRSLIVNYLDNKKFRITAYNWMDVQAYDPSMFRQTNSNVSHSIRLIQNPRLWANFRTMPRFAKYVDEGLFVRDCYEIGHGTGPGQMRIMNRSPNVFDSDKPIRSRFFIYEEEAACGITTYADIVADYFPIRYKGFLKEAARICGRNVEVARIYWP
jgi:hypothetical protein